jgi:SAM-dependent methyltransferase
MGTAEAPDVLEPAPSRGWFHTPGREGDRTLEQQLLGLEPIIARVRNATVLDVGCAEGLISHAMADAGARLVHGIEIIPGHVEVAKAHNGSRPCLFNIADANLYKPQRRYDIVLLLAILHKLTDPTEACMRFADAAIHTVVMRLPPETAPTIVDWRSGRRPHDMLFAMKRSGFALHQVERSAFNEWCGYFHRSTHEFD